MFLYLSGSRLAADPPNPDADLNKFRREFPHTRFSSISASKLMCVGPLMAEGVEEAGAVRFCAANVPNS